MVNQLRSAGIDAVGVDARPRGPEGTPQALARIEQLPFPDETFDLVLSSSVFDSDVYAQNQQIMLGEIQRVLKKGGILFSAADSISSTPEGMTLLSPEKDQRLNFEGVYKKN